MKVKEVIHETRHVFVVIKGDEYRPSFFSFFVDYDKTSWSRIGYFNARLFASKEEAEECLIEIKKRERFRREAKRSKLNANST